MNVFQSCSDLSDAISFSSSQGLYIKPVAKLNISVQLPSLKTHGKSISNWEVMEKLRLYVVPEEFISLKVSKSTLEVVRFEGEIENRSKLPAVLARLDGRSIKLSGFQESLKIRAAEAKADFPTRHSWDSYFRDAKNMNEMKPGERPDTIHIMNLPCKWFAAKSDISKPSEYVLRKVFEVFGEIRCVDIPMLDPFRNQMKSHISGIKMFSNNQNMIFEAYIQFKEYMCFVKTMDALRGMKLVHKDLEGKAFSAGIKVDFDKTKHLSDSSIRRRRVERERLMAKEREREEKERQAKEEEERKLAEDRKRIEAEKVAKLERQRQREERRKAKQLERLKQREADEMNQKIATEERLLLIAQRRLESYRLLDELFKRLKETLEKEKGKAAQETSLRLRNKEKQLVKADLKFEVKEKELREKLVKKFKHNGKNDKSKPKEEAEKKKEESEPELSDIEECFEGNRNFKRYGPRGGRGGWYSRKRRGHSLFRGNSSFRGNQFPLLPFQSFPYRGSMFPQRGFPRWPQFSLHRRGEGDQSFVPPPLVDSYYLKTALNDPYYKYFQKLTLGNRQSGARPYSRSRSRSRTYSRSYSRSRSRSYTRSRSRTWSRSRSRSRSRGRNRSRSRTRSRSRSYRSPKRNSSQNRSHSSRHSYIDERVTEQTFPYENLIVEKVPSLHTWSRSPSRSRSLSWEKEKDEPSSSTKSNHEPSSTKSHHKQKKDKKKKEKKVKKKKKKNDK